MKSKTSLYNFGFARNVISRSWPLWTAYFVTVFSLLPLFLVSANAAFLRTNIPYKGWMLDATVYESIELLPIVSFIFAAISAMVLFGFLYNNRSCGMMAALPIKRETMFSTIYLTGLAPMLICDCAAAACAFLLFGSSEYLTASALLTWLGAAVMSNIAFYGFAVFCAMLTGRLFVLPAVFLVLNCTTYVVWLTADGLLGEIVYGYTSNGGMILMGLSPLINCLEFVRFGISYPGEKTEAVVYTIGGMKLLAVYCAAGIVFSVFALLLFRKRRMETAGDTVAISILKPMFKYCLSLGTALVLSAVTFILVFDDMFDGTAATVMIAVLMLIGAFIGYFVAEMLIQRSFNVFRSGWGGMGICAAAVLAFCVTGETGMLGFENRVPAAGKIESVFVEINYNAHKMPLFDDEENIERVRELHEMLIEEKDYLEANVQTCGVVTIIYNLKNGDTLSRLYRYPNSEAKCRDSRSAALMQELVNSDTALQNRFPELRDISEEDIDYFEINYTDREGIYHYVRLHGAEAVDFYNNCIRPDGLENTLGKSYIYNTEENPEDMSTAYIYFSIRLTDGDENIYPYGYFSEYFNLSMNAERTIKWLTENSEVEIIPMSEVSEAFPEYAVG